MATISFYLQAKTPLRLSDVYLRYVDGRDCILRGIKTGYRVIPESLSKNKKGDIAIKTAFCNDEFTIEDARNIEAGLINLRGHLTKLPAGVVYTRDEMQDIVDKYRNPDRLKIAKDKPKNLNEYIKTYIEQAENGNRLTVKGQRFAADTIKSLKSWKMNFDEFQKQRRKEINYEDVHIDLHSEIVKYFHKKNFRTNTIGKFIKALKTFMQAAKDEGLHTSSEFLRKQFKAAQNEVDTIYLTADEVNALYKLEIEDEEMAVQRDIFLVGCYTAQRFSDYSRINEGNIRKLENGRIAVTIRQKKTDTEVTIPARPELIDILSRYNNKLPKRPEQYVNKNIKTICRMAGITQTVEIVEQIGGFTVRKNVEKCTMVCTHSARRTGATLMFLAGIPSLSVMKLTGHKTSSEFFKYIRLDARQTAEVISDNLFFNPPVKLKVV